QISDDTPPDSGSLAHASPFATSFMRRIVAQIISGVSGSSRKSAEFIGRGFAMREPLSAPSPRRGEGWGEGIGKLARPRHPDLLTRSSLGEDRPLPSGERRSARFVRLQ